jgi:SNF2 family DNA or RNA helicase
MRLGKTLTTIRWAEEAGLTSKPILVVAPLPVLATWQDELALEGHESRLLRGPDLKRADDAISSPESWYLTNYEGLSLRGTGSKRAAPSLLAKLPWYTVILDESTKIKNPKAQTTKVATECIKAKYRAILSGLPNPEGPLDLFTQMKFLLGEFMGFENFYAWRDEYFVEDRYNWAPRPGAIKLIRECTQPVANWLSRKDVNMGGPTVCSKRTVELPPPVKKVYDAVAADFILGDDITKWSTVCHIWLSQIAGGFCDHQTGQHTAKVSELLSLLKTDLRDEPIVIWFRFNTDLDGVKRALVKAGLNPAVLWGDDSLGVRTEVVRSFQKGRRDILLAQVKCATYGVDFSRARTAVYYGPIWSHQEMAQTMDRLIHPLKKDSVYQLFLLAEDTVDEKCYEAFQLKRLNSSVLKTDVLAHLKARAQKARRK